MMYIFNLILMSNLLLIEVSENYIFVNIVVIIFKLYQTKY